LIVNEWLSVVAGHGGSLCLICAAVFELENLTLVDEGGAAILTEDEGVLHVCVVFN
jgi:hypothetical protein